MGFAILYLTLPLFLGYCLYWYLFKYIPYIKNKKRILMTLRCFPSSEVHIYEGIRHLRTEYIFLEFKRYKNITLKDILENNYPYPEESTFEMPEHMAFHVKLFIEAYRPINYFKEDLYWPIGDSKSRIKFLDMLKDKSKDFYNDR